MFGNKARRHETVPANPPFLPTKCIEIGQKKISRGWIFFLTISCHSWYSEVAVQEIRRRWEDRFGQANSEGVTTRDNRTDPEISCDYFIELVCARLVARALAVGVANLCGGRVRQLSLTSRLFIASNMNRCRTQYMGRSGPEFGK